jgi:hypothetical protein
MRFIWVSHWARKEYDTWIKISSVMPRNVPGTRGKGADSIFIPLRSFSLIVERVFETKLIGQVEPALDLTYFILLSSIR